MRSVSKSPNGSFDSNGTSIMENQSARQVKASRAKSGRKNKKSVPENPVFGEVTIEEKCQLISEAAYYRAERRSFMPGNEIDDWLNAEAEIEKMLSEMGIDSTPRSA